MEHDYQVSGAVIGCAIEVHKALGPGLKESVYHNALCETLSRRNLAYASKRSFPVSFGGVQVGKYEPDLIVEGTVIIEVKAVSKMTEGIKRVVR